MTHEGNSVESIVIKVQRGKKYLQCITENFKEQNIWLNYMAGQ